MNALQTLFVCETKFWVQDSYTFYKILPVEGNGYLSGPSAAPCVILHRYM